MKRKAAGVTAEKPEPKKPALADLTEAVEEASELLREREQEHEAASMALEAARAALEQAQKSFDQGVADLKAAAPAGVGWNKTGAAAPAKPS